MAAACTPGDRGGAAYEPGIDNPLALKLTWFRYLGGEDVRRACGPRADDFYRLVYNGHYNEQLRSYEIAPRGDGGAVLITRVLTGSGIAGQIDLRLDDPLASWRWTKDRARLSPDDLARLNAALEQSAAFGPPPAGKRLYSNGFYWAVSGCRDGTFFLNAWSYPSERYAGLTFPDLLLSFDGTGIAFNPPRERDLDESLRGRRLSRALRGPGGPYFELEVGENGLRGL